MSRPVAVPPWLAHALRAQRGPVPWNAVTRGALSAGPLLAGAVLLLACAIVLVVGHLPMPGQRGGAVRARLAAASAAAQAYLTQVLGESADRAERWTLRREAYRTLAEARAAVALAAAELPPLARHSAGADQVVAALERLVDTTTACAVHLDDSGRLSPRHARQLAEPVEEFGQGRGPAGLSLPELPVAGLPGHTPVLATSSRAQCVTNHRRSQRVGNGNGK